MFLDTVKSVFASLNQHDVRYLLVGGLAVAAHGHSRATNDIDLVVALERENALNAIQSLVALGYKPAVPVNAADYAEAGIRKRWIEEKGMLVFQMRTGDPLDIPVDLFVTEPFAFEPAYEKAAKAELFTGVVVPVVPLDLLLAMKKDAGRPKDQEDIRVLRELHPDASGVS
ncbi:MAG: nucleotidyl transferase AbiEii/AbiGii toxin family protein [Nibricoccus sp.]